MKHTQGGDQLRFHGLRLGEDEPARDPGDGAALPIERIKSDPGADVDDP